MLKEKEKAHKQEKKEGKNPSKYFLLAVLFIFLYLIPYFPYKVRAQDSEIVNLEKLEEKVFHENYKNETTSERLNRLENLLFGIKFSGEPSDVRIKRINNALLPPLKDTPVPKNEKIISMQDNILKPETYNEKEDRKVIYDDSFNTGITGAIAQLEQKAFNQSYLNQPFQIRIANLEDKLLSKAEIIQNRKKPLLDRVAYLLQRGGIENTSGATTSSNTKGLQNNIPNTVQNYTIDPNTGYLINESTREIVKDGSGNPIMVKLPSNVRLPEQQFKDPYSNYQPSPLQQNPYLQYGNPLPQGGIPGQLPLDLFFNQENSNDSGIEDLGY